MKNKSNKITWLIAFLISALIVSYFVINITDNSAVAQMAGTQERIQGSLNFVEPKYTIKRTFYLTDNDSKSVSLHLVNFHCCSNTGAMLKDGALYIGYSNVSFGKPVGATTTMAIPELWLASIIHELHHLSMFNNVQHCTILLSRECLEHTAYYQETLYSQIVSLEEDGHIILYK